MSFVITQPETLDAAADTVAGIGAAVAAKNAAVTAPTTHVLPAAADQVSALTAVKFAAYGQLYQAIGSKLAAVLDQFVSALRDSARSYTDTEASNATALQTGTTPGQANPTGLLNGLANAVGPDITAPGSETATTGLAGLLNLLDNNTPTPLGNFLDSSTFNAFTASEWWNPTFIATNLGDMSALGYIISRMAAPLAAAQQAAGLSGATGPLTSHPGSFAPPVAGSAGLGGLGTPAGVHPDGAADITGGAAKAKLVRALSTSESAPALAGPPAMTGPTAAGPSAATAPLGIGAGSTMLPGTPMPGTVPGKGRHARRYGFRPTVTTRPPAGG